MKHIEEPRGREGRQEEEEKQKKEGKIINRFFLKPCEPRDNLPPKMQSEPAK